MESFIADGIQADSPKYAYSGYDKNSDKNINGDEASGSNNYTDSAKMSGTAASNVESLFNTAKKELNSAQQKVFGEKQQTAITNLKTRATNYASGALSQFSIMDSSVQITDGTDEQAASEQAKSQADDNISAKCKEYQTLVDNFMNKITQEAIETLKKEVQDIKEEPPAATQAETPAEENNEEGNEPVTEETESTSEPYVQHNGRVTSTITKTDKNVTTKLERKGWFGRQRTTVTVTNNEDNTKTIYFTINGDKCDNPRRVARLNNLTPLKDGVYLDNDTDTRYIWDSENNQFKQKQSQTE